MSRKDKIERKGKERKEKGKSNRICYYLFDVINYGIILSFLILFFELFINITHPPSI